MYFYCVIIFCLNSISLRVILINKILYLIICCCIYFYNISGLICIFVKLYFDLKKIKISNLRFYDNKCKKK